MNNERKLWRSLDQPADSHDEFPEGASSWSDPVSRRRLLELTGASVGLAGLTACTSQPKETIVPYVQAPEDMVPGKPLFYATAIPMAGFSAGVLVESHMGRPTKVEGNPGHPASLGATDIFAQASALTLYDPDRSQAVVREGRISSWASFNATVEQLRETMLVTQVAGFRILSERITSPSLAAQLKALLAEFPAAKLAVWEPVSRDHIPPARQDVSCAPMNDWR